MVFRSAQCAADDMAGEAGGPQRAAALGPCSLHGTADLQACHSTTSCRGKPTDYSHKWNLECNQLKTANRVQTSSFRLASSIFWCTVGAASAPSCLVDLRDSPAAFLGGQIGLPFEAAWLHQL